MGPQEMNLGPKGEALIKSFEKLALTAYRDSGGVLTIGWGHTGPEVVEGLTCTEQQAQWWLESDVNHAVRAVNELVRPTITQNEFDALVAFGFNVGVGAEAHSTLLKLVNACDWTGAAAEFPKWNHVNGIVSSGLSARRAAEQALFLA